LARRVAARLLALADSSAEAPAGSPGEAVVDPLPVPEDPMTVGLRAAEALSAAGRLADAERAFRDLIDLAPIGESPLGTENPEARAGLAAVLRRQARFGDAEDEYRAARDGFAAALGAEHERTLDARRGLAGVFGDRGRLLAAEVEYADMLEISTRRWGADHPRSAAVRSDLEKVRLLQRW
jgi:hypothetical protein